MSNLPDNVTDKMVDDHFGSPPDCPTCEGEGECLDCEGEGISHEQARAEYAAGKADHDRDLMKDERFSTAP